MGLKKIDEFGELPDLEDDEIWTEFREFSSDPVSFHDERVRRLYTFLSMLAAHQVLVLGIADRQVKRQKFKLEVIRAKLMRAKYYDIKTMSARTAAVETDEEYLKGAAYLMDIEDNFILEQSRLSALEKASAAVSRDISARIGR